MLKYEKIADWLEQKIAEGLYRPGQKLPSEQELREQFGVSRQTVRRALAVLEKRGAVYSRQGSGSFVADPQKEEEGKSRRIAVVTTYVDNYIFPKIIKGIEQVLSEENFQVQISFTNNRVQKETEILESLLDQELRGLIIEATKSALPNPNLPLYRRLLEKGVQVLFLNSGYPELDCPVVALDDREAGRCAARYLIEMGHRETGGLLKSDDGQGLRRYEGFLEELRAAKIYPDDNRFVWYDTGDLGHFDWMERRILNRFSGVTAVFCYNDAAAVELEELLRRNGIRVPEDISIVSVDDTDLASYGDVELTSVHHPKEKLGGKAARMMLAMIRQKKEPEMLKSFEFDAWLAIRESVRRCGLDGTQDTSHAGRTADADAVTKTGIQKDT